MRLTLESRRATRNLGRALASLLRPGDVVWLEGELGAGKTFFTRGLFRALGVPAVIPVTSPTYSLMHEHDGVHPLLHLDLYRLGSADELSELGLAELMDRSIVVIEWGGRFRDAIGARGIELRLSIPETERGRSLEIRSLDDRGASIAAGLARVSKLK